MSGDFVLIEFVELLQRPEGATKNQLLEVLERHHSGGSSIKTLERKLKLLRESYFIDIDYNKSSRRYQVVATPDLRHFNARSMSLYLISFLQGVSDIPEFIDFGIMPSHRNVRFIKEVSQAIASKQKLFLNYRKFVRDKGEDYRVIPILLRSWNNRWYLIARKEESHEIRNFGMDRIEGLRIIQEVHDYDVSEVVTMYNNIIGISGAEGEVEHVVIETNKYGGNFLRALNLHPSQRIIELSDELMKVEWNIVVNRELIEILCSLQQPFRIISPSSLKEKYQEHLDRLFEALDA